LEAQLGADCGGAFRGTSTTKLTRGGLARLPTMRQIFAAAVLVVAGIAAFIEAHSHRPITQYVCPNGSEECKAAKLFAHHHGLSQTAYDLLRIGAGALVIVGGLLVVTGLIRFWAAQARR
jgi:hypothetical protein